MTQNPPLQPSGIVHHVVYWGGVYGFQFLCDTPCVVANTTYRARVLTEVDSIGRTKIINLTEDPVDCMKCLVSRGCP